MTSPAAILLIMLCESERMIGIVSSTSSSLILWKT
jgi:hypothetical protein